jgi:hypothetical protein
MKGGRVVLKGPYPDEKLVTTLKPFKWKRATWKPGSKVTLVPGNSVFRAMLMDGVVCLKADPVEGEDYSL